MWRSFAALLLLVTPALAQDNATAYEALRVVGRQFGRGALNHIVSITGVRGEPQPEKSGLFAWLALRWKIVAISVCVLAMAAGTALERLFKALSDRHRLRILNVLLQAGEPVCVCEFQPTLGISQPTVSHHLKQLVEAGILEREKRGTYAYFRLKPGVLDRIAGLLAEPQTLAAA